MPQILNKLPERVTPHSLYDDSRKPCEYANAFRWWLGGTDRCLLIFNRAMDVHINGELVSVVPQRVYVGAELVPIGRWEDIMDSPIDRKDLLAWHDRWRAAEARWREIEEEKAREALAAGDEKDEKGTD